MRSAITLISATAEAGESVSQSVDAFGRAVASIVAEFPQPRSFSELFIGLSIGHPIYQASRRTSARFHKATDTIYTRAALDYDAWLKPDWQARVDAIAQAAEKAINAISNNRITTAERTSL